MSVKLTLSVSTLSVDKGKGTVVVVNAGPLIVARATLGGKWNNEQALRELRSSPKRFTMVGDGEVILRSLGIAA